LAGASDEYDGVAYLQIREHKPTRQYLYELSQMVVDEWETFSGPVLPIILRVDETVLKKGVPGGVTAFLFFDDPNTAEPVAQHYRDADAADRVILNIRNEALTTGDISSALTYKAVVEVSAHSSDDLNDVLGTSDSAQWRKADLACITRECIMFDRVS